MRISTILCSPNILREPSKEHSVIGASRYQQPLSRAWPCRHFPRRSLTSIVIDPLGYRQTSCSHNAISSVPTLTSVSINPVCSTRNGSTRISNPRKNRPNRKHPSRIRWENRCSRRPLGDATRVVLVLSTPRFAQRSDYRISENRVIRFRRVAHVGAV